MRGLHPNLPEQALYRTKHLSEGGKTARDSLLLGIGGFALSGLTPGGNALPFAACLILTQPFGLRALAAAAGSLAGYLLRVGGVDGMEQMAMCVLCFAAVAVFQGTGLPARSWFWPLMAGAVCGILGTVGLFGGRDRAPIWVLQWIAAAVGTWVFRGAGAGKQRQQILLLALTAGGLAGFPGGVDLGLVMGLGLCASLREVFPCAVVGAALELSGLYGSGLTVALLLPAVLCSFGTRGDSLLTLTFLLIPGGWAFLTEQAAPGLLLSMALGVGIGTVLRQWKYIPLGLVTEQKNLASVRLESAAGILDMIRLQLPMEEKTSVSEAESVYDGAADQVCRCCGRFHRCWEQRGKETFTILMEAAEPMIRRGLAEEEDFSPEFREGCCHFEGFLTAINQELEGMLFRRRYRMELRESRRVLWEELACLSDFLRSSQWEEEGRPPAFRPVVGACTVGKGGSRVSGDRGACFAGPNQDYFILLCDGMGTGTEASRCSGETLRQLEQLLRGGVDARSALKILNGMELLREKDRYTTVDLLRIDLVTGKGLLYKWGGAPSYWRSGDKLKKIGTASPPPGVGVGGDHTPEEYPLSLRRGELLVLTSDGAMGAETEEMVGAYAGSSVHELAALLVSGLRTEDDSSAVVVSLCPLS